MSLANVPKINGATKEELDIAQVLIDAGQGHLLSNWPPTGKATSDKRRLLQQAIALEKCVPGGLSDYVSRAKVMLENSRAGLNPYEGYIPKVPIGAVLETETPEGLVEFERLEGKGLEEVGDTVFVIVAGGLGERLGYNGIKVALPSEISSNVCFLDLYCRYILALQEKARCSKGDNSIIIPFAIMTSGDTHEKTTALIDEHKNFGMADGQIVIIKQEKVPALNNNDAEFVLKKDDPYSLITKPHGHGDVHTLIYTTGLSKKWADQGKKWVVFFQDTNGLVFRALPATIGVSIEKKLAVNSLTVPRRPGEAVGAICRLESDTKPSMTINVEYNQLDALMTASGVEDKVGENGFSSFPGNINVLVFDAQSYAGVMEKTKGQIPEFVNPKYKDKEKTIFKKPTRLESMMQDYPKCLEADVPVGFTQCERWTCFSAVKNNVIDAVAKFKKTGFGECAACGEADIFWAHRRTLKIAGAEIDLDGKEIEVEGVTIKRGANVVLLPSFASVLSDVKEKIKGLVTISNASTLILDGSSIRINKLELDGALVVHVGTDAKLTIDCKVNNKGWSAEKVSQDDTSVDEEIRIRGYLMKKNEQKIVDLRQEKGIFLLTNTDSGELKIVKSSDEEKEVNKSEESSTTTTTTTTTTTKMPKSIEKDCEICYSDDICLEFNCEHSCCVDCVVGYVKSQIDIPKIPIVCMDTNCDVKYEPDWIFAWLADDLEYKNKYGEFLGGENDEYDSIIEFQDCERRVSSGAKFTPVNYLQLLSPDLQELFGSDIFRLGVWADGCCFYHCIWEGIDEEYQSITGVDNESRQLKRKTGQNKRVAFGKKNEEKDIIDCGIIQYNANDPSRATLSCKEVLDNIINPTYWAGDEDFLLIQYKKEINIFLINSDTGNVAVDVPPSGIQCGKDLETNYDDSQFMDDRPTLLILYHKNLHFELLVKVDKKEKTMTRLFQNSDVIIKQLRSAFTKERALYLKQIKALSNG